MNRKLIPISKAVYADDMDRLPCPVCGGVVEGAVKAWLNFRLVDGMVKASVWAFCCAGFDVQQSGGGVDAIAVGCGTNGCDLSDHLPALSMSVTNAVMLIDPGP